MAFNFRKYLAKDKIVKCPRCYKRLRVPVKKGSTLRITCPACQANFELKFLNPLTALLRGQVKFKDFPAREKWRLALFLVSLLILAYFLYLSTATTQKNKQKIDQPPQVLEEVLENKIGLEI